MRCAARSFTTLAGACLLAGSLATLCAEISYAVETRGSAAVSGQENQSATASDDELQAILEEFEEETLQPAIQRPDYRLPTYDYLDLGIDGAYMKRERFRLRDQITTFIPPLYQPAFVGHGYVLPPDTWRIAVSATSFDIGSDDFFKSGEADMVHEQHGVSRRKVSLDVFYGLDHDMTIRVSVPYWTSQSFGSVHPAGVRNMDLFVEGTSTDLGDISVFLKKKFWDQGNHKFNFAGVIGLKLPTGADDKKFDAPMVVRDPMGNLNTAFAGGAFPRFSDDGRLPSVLQPGTGALGTMLGLFGTRQFLGFRGAFHAGFLARFLAAHEGVDPGNELRFFASAVKPVYRDYVSLELAVNGMKKGADHYEGPFTHPIPDPDTGMMAGFATTPRPSFREGTVVFASPSLIFIPNPWLRLTATGMFRLNQPALGPWPGQQLLLSSTVTF